MSQIDEAPDLAVEGLNIQEKRLNIPNQLEAISIGGNKNEGKGLPTFTRMTASGGGSNNFGSGGPNGSEKFFLRIFALPGNRIKKVFQRISLLFSYVNLWTLLGVIMIMKLPVLRNQKTGFLNSFVEASQTTARKHKHIEETKERINEIKSLLKS